MNTPAPEKPDEALRRACELHRRLPLIDGHNDLVARLRKLGDIGFNSIDISQPQADLHTDIPRLRTGRVGGQFWAMFSTPTVDDRTALIHCIDGIDTVHRMERVYPDTFTVAYSAEDAGRIFASGRIAAFIGIEGGRVLNGSIGVLRMLYRLGARYLTLTHNQSHDWADSATDEARHGGLTAFGREVIREMNALGMLVDLSHTSPAVMRAALDISTRPVVFTHANAYTLNPHPRNVPDDVLDRVAAGGGLVMATFVPAFLDAGFFTWSQQRTARVQSLQAKQDADPAARDQALAEWVGTHPAPRVTSVHVADHIDYLVKRMGIDCVGIGSDFDGIHDVPEDVYDVSCFPRLTAELMRRGYSEEDLRKLLGGNILRML